MFAFFDLYCFSFCAYSTFLLTILPNETVVSPSFLGYLNTYALQTSRRCGVIDLDTGLCAAQNLPVPSLTSAGSSASSSTSSSANSTSNTTSSTSDLTSTVDPYGTPTPPTITMAPVLPRQDLLSSANLHLSPAPAFITSLQFLPDDNSSATWSPAVRHTVQYEIGSLIKVLVTFSEAVYVYGRPYIDLYLVTQTSNDTATASSSSASSSTSSASATATPFLVLFTSQVDPHTLLFTTSFSQYTLQGHLTCRPGASGVRLNGAFAQIRRAANFFPLQGAELDLSNVCATCPGGSDVFQTEVTTAGWVVGGDPAEVVSALSVRRSVSATGAVNATYGMVSVGTGVGGTGVGGTGGVNKTSGVGGTGGTGGVVGLDVTGVYGEWTTRPRIDTERVSGGGVGGGVSGSYGVDPVLALYATQAAAYTGMRGRYGAPPCAPAGAVGAQLVGSRPAVTRVYSTLQGIFSAPEHLVLLVVFSGDVEVRWVRGVGAVQWW